MTNVPTIPPQWEEDSADSILVNTTREATSLKDSIRIFTERECLLAATSLPTANDSKQLCTDLVVYTDGSYLGNSTDKAQAGSGIWYGDQDPQNTALQVLGDRQSNQVGKLLVILHTVKTMLGNQPLRIWTNLRFAVDGLTKYTQEWEARDWLGVTHGQLFKCTMAWLQVRTADTTLERVKGHAGIEGNEEADKLAAIGAQKVTDWDGMDLCIPVDMMAMGAMLAKVGQSTIYHHLTNQGLIDWKATSQNVERVKIATKELFEITLMEKVIWVSIRHKDVLKKIRDFLWKHMHGIYRLGNFWSHIPGYGERAKCLICGKYDTFGHIAAKCDSMEWNTVWEQANGLWRQRYSTDLPPRKGLCWVQA